MSSKKKILSWRWLFFALATTLTISVAAEDVRREAFLRNFSNYHLGVSSFIFDKSGKCFITLEDPTDKSSTYHCTWKQEGKTNKLIVTWLSGKYKKMKRIPKEGDIYYLILSGDSPESMDRCLVRKPMQYDTQDFRRHDVFELSNGLPLCFRMVVSN